MQEDLQFGASLDTDGVHLLIGATGQNNGFGITPGGAYSYQLNNEAWTLEANLTPVPTPLYGLSTGRAIAVFGDHAVVGSKGRLFPYRKINATWEPMATIESPGLEQEFGASLAIGESNLITSDSEGCVLYGHNTGQWLRLPVSDELNSGPDEYVTAMSGSQAACVQKFYSEPGVSGTGIVRIVTLPSWIMADGFE